MFPKYFLGTHIGNNEMMSLKVFYKESIIFVCYFVVVILSCPAFAVFKQYVYTCCNVT